jgi:hypothetical protein
MQMTGALHIMSTICCCLSWTRLHDPVTAVAGRNERTCIRLVSFAGPKAGIKTTRLQEEANSPYATGIKQSLQACTSMRNSAHTTLFTAQGLGMRNDEEAVPVLLLAKFDSLVLASCRRRAIAALGTHSSTSRGCVQLLTGTV